MPPSGRFLLGTNIVIAFLEGDDAVISNLELAPEVFIPAVTLAAAGGEGSAVPENDIWIAATAKSHGLLVTRDRHFRQIEDLQTADWSAHA